LLYLKLNARVLAMLALCSTLIPPATPDSLMPGIALAVQWTVSRRPTTPTVAQQRYGHALGRCSAPKDINPRMSYDLRWQDAKRIADITRKLSR
jgi:hypothetical protein